MIRDLLSRVSSCPSRLDWRRFAIAETPSNAFIGCGQLKPHFDRSLELASLAVDTPYRRQGVARAIIERLLANGPGPLYTTCRAELAALYAKFGFRPIGLTKMPFSLLCECVLLLCFLWLSRLSRHPQAGDNSATIRETTDAIRRDATVVRLG